MILPCLTNADRRALLLGTALASTLLLATVTAPAPARAVPCVQPASPNPISDTAIAAPITCVNTVARTGDAVDPDAIRLDTSTVGGTDRYITLDNTGRLTSYPTGHGIYASTGSDGSYIDITNMGIIETARTGILAYTSANGDDSPITINNSGNIFGTGYNGVRARARGENGDITIVNSGDVTFLDTTGTGIYARTYDDDSRITVFNSGALSGIQYGIFARTGDVGGDNSSITIINSGDIIARSTNFDPAFGIFASTGYDDSDPRNYSPITIVNSASIRVSAPLDEAHGIRADTEGEDSPVSIVNRGNIRSTGELAYGISAETDSADSRIDITNSGDLRVSADNDAYGILAETDELNGRIDITNSGNVHATGASALGILAATDGGNSTITIVESAAITATGTFNAFGIYTRTIDDDSNISITNASHITATAATFGPFLYAVGIHALTAGFNSDISITNSGDIDARNPTLPYGIRAIATYQDSSITIENSGNVTSTSETLSAAGIVATTYYGNSPISIVNSGNVTSNGSLFADGVGARTYASPINITNSGNVTATASALARGIIAESYYGGGITIKNWGKVTTTAQYSYGIDAYTYGANSPLTIVNSGHIAANGGGPNGYALGILAETNGPGSPIQIQNAGSIFGADAGIHIHTYSGAGATIVNSGDISAGSLLAIDAHGPGNVSIFNSGTITGFVLLDADDRFINQAGGVFEARRTSDFDATGPGGNDLFVNQAGGTVHAINLNGQGAGIVNLERFENAGLISLVDNRPGDSFTLSNTPGGTDLDFVASGNSALAVDAFLGGPGNSSSDTFTIEGDVSGVTTVQVVNTNYGPGVFNPSGIRVVTATGATPNPNAFQLDQPIDTGFFDYDLFFTPTGSGFWELRSFPGGGAFLLPQLVTAAQDIWHQSSSTWFDRTADLRVLMAGGSAPTAYDPGGKSLGAAAPYSLTPAVWARGSGSWLDRDDTARTTAYGRNYTFDMDRDLQTLDFQVGVDMGKHDALSQGDALVFGLLGGFVHGDLDYDALARSFNFDGGQVGAYATYLNGGLFVDTLLNVHLYSLETSTLGFPSSLDANTVGLRTDTGYRFGSFSGGPFIEPLATIEMTWADIDGFSLGGNTVSFDDDANVRGRLGLRAGTTMAAWEGTLMEPFVTGSLWGNLTDDNSATLVSTGRTFRFEDQLDDVWGEVSAGVNVFNFTQTTAVFAKVDVTFGDDLTGVGGKAGMRVNW